MTITSHGPNAPALLQWAAMSTSSPKSKLAIPARTGVADFESASFIGWPFFSPFCNIIFPRTVASSKKRADRPTGSRPNPATPIKTVEVVAYTIWCDCCRTCCEECRKASCQKQHVGTRCCRKCHRNDCDCDDAHEFEVDVRSHAM
jgi:hypothetical protein